MKTDVCYPIDQFRLPGYASSFYLDHDQYDGRIAVFIKETKPIQCLNTELDFCKKKWL